MTAATSGDPRIDALTRTDTSGAHRFLGMGFRLYDVQFDEDIFTNSTRVRARFTCVCGRTEYWNQIIEEHAALEWQNIYDAIVRFGSTDRGHLLDDGYTEAQIEDMERRVAAFEMTADIARRAWHDVRGLRYTEPPKISFRESSAW